MTEKSLIELRAERAKLDQSITVAEHVETNHAHFHDKDGNVIPDEDLTTAMLRAAGMAMEKRAQDITWKTMSVADLEQSIHAAVETGDYIGAVLFAAALNAKTTIGG